MKQLIQISLLIYSFTCATYGQQTNQPGIKFDTLIHDFGLLEKGSNASCSFIFVNRAESPVIITNVKSSCGCTVPEWPKEPVLPGGSGSIQVRYNTQITGIFQKTINIYSSQNSQPIVLTIKGSVKKKERKRKPE